MIRRESYPGWRDDARRLHAQGLSVDAISAELDIKRCRVALVLDEGGLHARRNLLRRGRYEPPEPATARQYFEKWKPRKIARTFPAYDAVDLALKHLRGEIDLKTYFRVTECVT